MISLRAGQKEEEEHLLFVQLNSDRTSQNWIYRVVHNHRGLFPNVSGFHETILYYKLRKFRESILYKMMTR